MPDGRFLFATCQRGAETALKSELTALVPELRPSFSRPGYVTFKAADDAAFPPHWESAAVFARSLGWSLGKVRGDSGASALAAELAAAVAGLEPFEQLHVWPRDAAAVGYRGFEPGHSDDSSAAAAALAAAMPGELLRREENGAALAVRAGQRVLDVILVEPGEWWFGWHVIRRGDPWTRWPGGIFHCDIPEAVVSRAYVKMREALACFRFPIKRGETALEIGSSPGGSSQALLQAGLKVIGVDPAEMSPALLAESKFTHWRMRGTEIRKSHCRDVKWLTADVNAAPGYTLDVVEGIVTNQHVKAAGLLLTIKLPEWELAGELPQNVERIRSWGFEWIRARQMSHNRQEYCLAALRRSPGK